MYFFFWLLLQLGNQHYRVTLVINSTLRFHFSINVADIFFWGQYMSESGKKLTFLEKTNAAESLALNFLFESARRRFIKAKKPNFARKPKRGVSV